MRRWLFLLGGLLIWAAHFTFIYIVASISDLQAGEATPIARVVIGASGAAAAVAALLLLRAAIRARAGEPLETFWRSVSALGAVIALIAILWQTLPALSLAG